MTDSVKLRETEPGAVAAGRCLAQKVKRIAGTVVSEARTVAAGRKFNLKSHLYLTIPDHDSLNLRPVATARGSDGLSWVKRKAEDFSFRRRWRQTLTRRPHGDAA
jgi:hypothetical protein